MSSSLSNLLPPPVDSVSHVAVLDWLSELRAAMRTASFSELFDFDGVNALDVLLSPLYLSVLNSLRSGETQLPDRPFISQVRDWAYHRKVAWQQQLAAWRGGGGKRGRGGG